MLPTSLIVWDGKMFVRGNSLLLIQRWGVSPPEGRVGLMLKEGWAAAGPLLAFRLSHCTDHPVHNHPVTTQSQVRAQLVPPGRGGRALLRQDGRME